MKKYLYAVIAILCLVPILFSGCTQAVPVSASAQPDVSVQASVSSASAASATVQPTTTPSATASQTPSATASPTVSASVSPSAVASPSASTPYKVAVPYDLDDLKNSQKSVDEGHSPWKLDPAFVAQVFVSLQIEPGGIVGDYPIPYEDFKVAQQNKSDAVVEVKSDKSPTSKVYLKQLVKQGDGGIWTVVGYDPK